jgi:hypothetical protein
MDLRYKELYWVHGRPSPLSINNKLLLYKTVIAPIWTYGLYYEAVHPSLTQQSFRGSNQNY